MSNHIKSDGFFSSGFPICVMNLIHQGNVFLHDHSFYELVYIENGFAMHTWEKNNTVLTSGDVFIISPGHAHSYIGACNTRIYNCLFLKSAIENDIDKYLELPGLSDILKGEKMEDWAKVSLDLSQRQQISYLLNNMLWETVNKPSGWEIKVKALFSELLIFYSRTYERCRMSSSDNMYMQYVYRALNYIQDNFYKDFFIKDIADYVRISPDYLTRHFKQILGVTPVEYVKTFRVAKAIELLKMTEKSISEISVETGFSEISHFSRQFKQMTGVSPSQFRKEQLNI